VIHVRCHKCNKKYAVPDDAKGKRIRCRRCQQVIVVSEDVRDWLDAMSYAADKWQTDEVDEAAAEDAKPAPADTAISPTEDAPPSHPGDNPVEAPPFQNEPPPPAGIDPVAESADQTAPAMNLAVNRTLPSSIRPLPITPPVMRLLMAQTLLTAFAVGGFLLVLGLWLGHGVASPGLRYVVAVLAGFGSLAILGVGLLISWRVARHCRDLDRHR
jgi:hypothetical protein